MPAGLIAAGKCSAEAVGVPIEKEELFSQFSGKTELSFINYNLIL